MDDAYSSSGLRIARVYDAIMGGKDNYADDRIVAEQIFAAIPGVQRFAEEYRAWRARAIRFLARSGIRQFVDCGPGFPRWENTHEIAQREYPAARTIYVDGDPHVGAHGRALLAGDGKSYFVRGRITRPLELFADPAFSRLVDLDEPIGLIHCSTIHHVPDGMGPHDVVRAYVDLLPSGSYLALAHYHDPDDGSEVGRLAGQAADILNSSRLFDGRGASVSFRTREQITRFFDGLEAVEPGLVFLRDWWPDGPHRASVTEADQLALGGVARKP